MTEIEMMRAKGWTIQEIADAYDTTPKVISAGLKQTLHEERYE